MANNDWDDFDDESGDGSELVKKLRNQLKQANKRNSELEAAQEGLAKKVRQREVKDVLDAKGVNPKIARWVLADVEDPTEESVTEWLVENGELFGVTGVDGAEGARQTVPKGMSVEDIAAQRSINQFVDQTDTAGASTTQEQALAIENADNLEDLMKAIGKSGGGVTPFFG